MNKNNIHLTLIAGARPNFMKIAPIIHAIHNHNSLYFPPPGGTPQQSKDISEDGAERGNNCNSDSSPQNTFIPYSFPPQGEMSAYGTSEADKGGLGGDASVKPVGGRQRGSDNVASTDNEKVTRNFPSPGGGVDSPIGEDGVVDSNTQTTKKIFFRLVHTGQHYDQKMSETFFEELNIPKPDVNLGCGGGTQAEQTAAIMIAFEKDLLANPTDLVIVVGDVTSTMACSIVAKKLNTKVAHVEAGIRSWDLTMPEEINRMVTDSLADYFFTTTGLADQNLKNNGIPEDRIFRVGNVMIDTLLANRHRFQKPKIWDSLKLNEKEYLVMTLHRPANVDEGEKLKKLIHEIVHNVQGLPVIFPIHPRTAKIFNELGIEADNLKIVEPMGYLEFNYLVERAKAVITDSGGITEETTVMGIPCITLRDNTERPETISIGTNELIGTNPAAIKPALDKLYAGKWKKGEIPELWDGKTADRIIQHLPGIFA